MNNNRAIVISFLIFTSIYLFSCSRDAIVTPNNPVNFTIHGAYIVCEGTFSTSPGLSFYDFRTGAFTQNVFHPGTPAPFANGLVINNSSLYMTSKGISGAGEVYKLDTLGNVISSSALNNSPAGIANVFDKLFVSTGPDSSVTVLNSSTLNVNKKIKAGYFPDEILNYGDRIFVCNSQTVGGLSDNRVTVIDAFADTVLKQVRVSLLPTSIALSNDKQILVGCKRSGNAVMYKIDPFSLTVSDSIIIPTGFVSDISVDRSTDNIYFIQDANHIASLDFVSRNVVTALTVSDPGAVINSYAFDYEARKHCIGAAYTISLNGKFLVYNIDTNLEHTFETLAGPVRIVIKNTF